VAIVGPSGTGKTTIAGLIPRFYDPQSGRIKIDGTDIREFTLKSLRDQVSFVLQDTLLFRGTVWENIAYGKPDAEIEDTVHAPPSWPTRTSSSSRCRSATRPWSASVASRSRRPAPANRHRAGDRP
jgi:ABC-type branched-subunit amino acid transport system ATPase component